MPAAGEEIMTVAATRSWVYPPVVIGAVADIAYRSRAARRRRARRIAVRAPPSHNRYYSYRTTTATVHAYSAVGIYRYLLAS